MNWESIKSIATQLALPDVAETLEKRLNQLTCTHTRISIIGGGNVGKSTLINALVGTNLETSSLPTAKTIRITYKGEGDFDTVESESEWLKEKNLEIQELAEPNQAEFTLFEFGAYLTGADICVMLLNSMSALNRTETQELDFLEELGIPTILVLSKADYLDENQYLEVEKHVAKITDKYKSVELLMSGRPLLIEKLAIEVRNAVDKLLQDSNPRTGSRTSLIRLFELEALQRLSEECQKKIEQVDEYQIKVEARAKDRKSKLSDAQTIWLQLQTTLLDNKSKTTSAVKELFEKNKDTAIRQLSHKVEMCGDVKLFWEKDLPFCIEDSMKANSQAAERFINANVTKTLDWFYSEVKKSFNKTLNVLPNITCSVGTESFVPSETLNIADNQKLRIVTRIGTATTVIAAGTMCATMGIGGAVLATSMLSGIVADLFIGRNQKKSKEKVIALIPLMVEQAQHKLIVNVSDGLDNSYNEVIKNWQMCYDSWHKEAEQNIESERLLALKKCQIELDKWSSCSSEINKLSDSIKTINKQ